jgi:hypothetical protein
VANTVNASVLAQQLASFQAMPDFSGRHAGARELAPRHDAMRASCQPRDLPSSAGLWSHYDY